MKKIINNDFDKRDKYFYVFSFDLMLKDGYKDRLYTYGHMRQYDGWIVDFYNLDNGDLKSHIRHWWIDPKWCYRVKKNSKAARHIRLWRMTRLKAM